MKYWLTEHYGNEIRIEWNESATFNLQMPVGGEWVDYHCFTCYGIETELEALEMALDTLKELDEEYYNEED